MNAARRLGAYELLAELGAGAFGRVYRARHEPTGALRALKVLSVTEPEARARFQREAEALAKLDGHPNVIRIHELGAAGGSVFFAMELAEGGSLRDRLAREKTLEP